MAKRRKLGRDTSGRFLPLRRTKKRRRKRRKRARRKRKGKKRRHRSKKHKCVIPSGLVASLKKRPKNETE